MKGMTKFKKYSNGHFVWLSIRHWFFYHNQISLSKIYMEQDKEKVGMYKDFND